MGLALSDYRMLLRLIGSLYSARTLDELHEAIGEGLTEALPGDAYDLVLFAGNHPGNDAFLSKEASYTESEMRYMLENVTLHPLVPSFLRGDTGAICISQLIPFRHWRNSEFFWESGYQRLRLNYELATLLPDVSPTSRAAISVLRTSRDFVERDREFLNHLRPHLGRALKQALSEKSVPSLALARQIFPQLSEREAEVLFWITEGKQNREIADILERSLNTVQEHVENITRKLCMENRHALATFALRSMMEG